MSVKLRCTLAKVLPGSGFYPKETFAGFSNIQVHFHYPLLAPEEFNDQEYNTVHNMFWECVNILLADGQMPQEMIQQSKAAVQACKAVDVTIGGDIIDLAIEMWEDAH